MKSSSAAWRCSTSTTAPRLETLLRNAGATIEHLEARPSADHDSTLAARTTALTLKRFDDQAPRARTQRQAIDAAITALHDPAANLGPTLWIVRCCAAN